MSDIFISYARSTEGQAKQVAEALRALGYGVWRDDEIPANRAYADVIAERLAKAKAVVVIWSTEAVKSHWVRSEAERARADDKLVQLNLDGARLPMPFDQTQCADLAGWTGDDTPGWKQVVGAIAGLASPSRRRSEEPARAIRKLSICVLPFANMSGDPEQEYFSDGISEDIITDLSKVSALEVVSRNTAFSFKGRSLKVPDVARELGVSHVLEGSVRKAGGRVRITAQLIDGSRDSHVWAERYDRDLTDIFALQDEISEAIVTALKLKLLPEEKRAIERRGTDNADAYDLYLMARRYMLSGGNSGVGRAEAMIRLCRRATEADPNYALAWALMAIGYVELRFIDSNSDDGLAAAERAIELDPNLAEAHAAKARHLGEQGRHEEASAEIELALRLDPGSYDVNIFAGRISYRRRQLKDAARYFEKAAAIVETDFDSGALAISAYAALGDMDAARRAARMVLARAERALTFEPENVAASSYGAYSLAALGESSRAKDWIDRALLIDPDNLNMRYNLGCALSVYLKGSETALEILGPFFDRAPATFLNHARHDPDLDPLREDPRFQAMLAAAEARLAAAPDGVVPT
jgi:adenylate cyclase